MTSWAQPSSSVSVCGESVKHIERFGYLHSDIHVSGDLSQSQQMDWERLGGREVIGKVCVVLLISLEEDKSMSL